MKELHQESKETEPVAIAGGKRRRTYKKSKKVMKGKTMKKLKMKHTKTMKMHKKKVQAKKSTKTIN